MRHANFKKSGKFHLSMMMVLAVCLPAVTLSAQNNNKKNDNQPKVNINVHRKYDKKGNEVGYDSTYTWSWSSNGSMPSDSMMRSMEKNFGMNFSSGFPNEEMFGPGFFGNDSLMGQGEPNDSLMSRSFGGFGPMAGQSMDKYFRNMDKHLQQIFGDEFNGENDFFKDFQDHLQQKPLIPGVKNDSIPAQKQQNNYKHHPKADNYNIIKT
jgi:hypothetical protein